jgi:hypothetical protein
LQLVLGFYNAKWKGVAKRIESTAAENEYDD